MGILGIDWVQS